MSKGLRMLIVRMLTQETTNVTAGNAISMSDIPETKKTAYPLYK